MPRQSNASLKNYMNELEKVVETVEPIEPVIIKPDTFDPPDILDVPDHPVEKRSIIVENHTETEPVVEIRPPHVIEPILEECAPKLPEPLTEAREIFYERLLEKLDHLQDTPPISVVVETTENHIERLLKIEKSMLDLTTQCIASVKQKLQEEVMETKQMIDHLVVNRDMIDVIVGSQQRIVESQTAMIVAIADLSLKIAAISTNQPVVNVPAPIVNIPAPIVNITENSRRTTKMVERDENGLITKVIENSGSEDD